MTLELRDPLQQFVFDRASRIESRCIKNNQVSCIFLSLRLPPLVFMHAWGYCITISHNQCIEARTEAMLLLCVSSSPQLHSTESQSRNPGLLSAPQTDQLHLDEALTLVVRRLTFFAGLALLLFTIRSWNYSCLTNSSVFFLASRFLPAHPGFHRSLPMPRVLRLRMQRMLC
ncbi:hypothetical protein P280DRAFT_166296 [Massarina eburnea CBS 473.64]|uniref:Uncharacterized protein n=1 Tax=Massarina eburnea CBS 473.64 TaxID=1395130 RepID=A0A6A6RMS5_9PLEO|nr:hypothetical protein P280DRAFT_166296 [Massarina eburnea CBS 473.64]